MPIEVGKPIAQEDEEVVLPLFMAMVVVMVAVVVAIMIVMVVSMLLSVADGDSEPQHTPLALTLTLTIILTLTLTITLTLTLTLILTITRTRALSVEPWQTSSTSRIPCHQGAAHGPPGGGVGCVEIVTEGQDVMNRLRGAGYDELNRLGSGISSILAFTPCSEPRLC